MFRVIFWTSTFSVYCIILHSINLILPYIYSPGFVHIFKIYFWCNESQFKYEQLLHINTCTCIYTYEQTRIVSKNKKR